jgi:hypothetical protein
VGCIRPEAESHELDRIRQLPRWAAAHVRNRTLPQIVFLSIVSALVAGLLCLAVVIARAEEAGAPAGRQAAYLAGAAALFACLLWFRFVVGRRVSRAIADCIDGRGGRAEAAAEGEHAGMERYSAAHLIVLGAMLAWAFVSAAGFIPPRYLQPTLATILVPCLLYFHGIRYRGLVSPFLLLWPALYGLHALLLVAGVPIYLAGGPADIYSSLNVALPALGYGLAAAIAGHAYSRYALRRLVRLAREGEAGAAAEGAQE